MNQSHGNLTDGPATRRRALVVGAWTLIGRRMLEAAATTGWPPEEIVFTSHRRSGGSVMMLDMSQPENFRPALGFETVIVCAPIWLISPALLERLHALGMRRLVAFSSTSLLTKGESELQGERDVVAQLEAGEAVVREGCAALDVRYTILRPTLIYDEGHDANVSQIAQFVQRLGFFPVCGKASGLRQPVHARDLAVAALLAVGAQQAHDKTYNLSGGETLTYRSMVERICHSLGANSLIIGLPEWLWRLGFALLAIVKPGTGARTNIQMAIRMNRDLCFDHAEAVSDFGYAPSGFKPDFRAVLEATTNKNT